MNYILLVLVGIISSVAQASGVSITSCSRYSEYIEKKSTLNSLNKSFHDLIKLNPQKSNSNAIVYEDPTGFVSSSCTDVVDKINILDEHIHLMEKNIKDYTNALGVSRADATIDETFQEDSVKSAEPSNEILTSEGGNSG